MAFLLVRADGSIEHAFESGSLREVERDLAKVLPKHTPVFLVTDPASPAIEAEGRKENGEATPELAMKLSGLPWSPKKRVGITLREIEARYPLDKKGLEKAYRDIIQYFPHTAKEHGFDHWRTPALMARHLLKTNTKTAKAIEGVGVTVPPSYAVGVNLMPYGLGAIESAKKAPAARRDYLKDPKNAARPVTFRELPLVAEGRRMQTPLGLCAGSTEACRSSCLVFTGQNGAVRYNDISKLNTERALYFEPLAFGRMLIAAIEAHVRYCRKQGLKPFVRLNVYSDIPWELFFPDLFDHFEAKYGHDIHSGGLWFYDYTKVPGRGARPKPNYDLTFSFSGQNLDACKKALHEGMRVAVVFLRKTAKGSKKQGTYKPAETVTDLTWLGYAVIDGDPYDMRPLDPGGVIVGLRFKVPNRIQGKREEAAEKAGDFVMRPPKANEHFLVRAEQVDGQWVFPTVPLQTNVDMLEQIRENDRPAAAE